MAGIQVNYVFDDGDVFYDDMPDYIPQVGDVVEFEDVYIVDNVKRKAVRYLSPRTRISIWYFNVFLKKKKNIGNGNID